MKGKLQLPLTQLTRKSVGVQPIGRPETLQARGAPQFCSVKGSFSLLFVSLLGLEDYYLFFFGGGKCWDLQLLSRRCAEEARGRRLT